MVVYSPMIFPRLVAKCTWPFGLLFIELLDVRIVRLALLRCWLLGRCRCVRRLHTKEIRVTGLFKGVQKRGRPEPQCVGSGLSVNTVVWLLSRKCLSTRGRTSSNFNLRLFSTWFFSWASVTVFMMVIQVLNALSLASGMVGTGGAGGDA